MDVSYYETITKAAKRTGLSAVRVRQLAAAGKIKNAVLMDGQLWLIPNFWEPTSIVGRPRKIPVAQKKSCSPKIL
jgi:hypothetical protein